MASKETCSVCIMRTMAATLAFRSRCGENLAGLTAVRLKNNFTGSQSEAWPNNRPVMCLEYDPHHTTPLAKLAVAYVVLGR